jgi:S1-C subfamily serine protease
MALRIQQIGAGGSETTCALEGVAGRVVLRADGEVELLAADGDAPGPFHGEIRLEDGRWCYRDCGSAAGSWIGGRRIDELVLAGGEEIEIGRGGPSFRIELGDETTPETETAEPAPPEGTEERHRESGEAAVPAVTFVREIADQVARRRSCKVRNVSIATSVALVAAIAALLLWRMRSEGAIGEEIARENGSAVYLLLYRDESGVEKGFCTGFAVEASALLTNAHCVEDIARLAEAGNAVFAALNNGGGARYRVADWKAHPGYDPASTRPTADVGLLHIKGSMGDLVTLADASELEDVRPGVPIFVFGFPGDLNDVRSPVATLTEGVIGRLTTFDGKQGDASAQSLIQHSAFVTKGTSGSPVFDRNGRVVAVNSGYYQGKSRVRIDDLVTGETKEAEVSRDLSGYSFSVRVDVARGLLGE